MKFSERQVKDFWAKVDYASNPEGCWEWQAAISHRGYGLKNNLQPDGKKGHIHAHRMAWILENGDIPEGMLVCHKCDNRRCCRASHLFLGTAKENTQDMIAKGRHSTPPACPRRFTAEDAAKMLEHNKAGLSLRAIAKLFKTTHGMVSRVIYEGRYQQETN